MKTAPSSLRSSLLITTLLLVANGAGFAATVGSDNSSNYSTWTNGSNAGTGFNPWILTTAGSPSGFFLGSSTNVAPSGATGIDTGGTSFGMYANGGSSAVANATRDFAGGALAAGQGFSLNLAVNYRNGNKGIDILNSGGTAILNFNIGGDDYVVNDATTGDGSVGVTYSSNTEFKLIIDQTSVTGGTWEIDRTGGVTSISTGSYSGDAVGFHAYINNTDNTSNSDFYINGLTVVPEPSTWSLLAAFGGFLALLRFRRSRS